MLCVRLGERADGRLVLLISSPPPLQELAWTALFLGLKDVERASRLETIVRLVLSKMYSNNKPMFMRLVSAPTSSSEPEFQRIQRIMLYHEEIFAATLCYDFNAETPHPGFARGWRKQFGPEWELGISERQRYEAIGAQFIDIGYVSFRSLSNPARPRPLQS